MIRNNLMTMRESYSTESDEWCALKRRALFGVKGIVALAIAFGTATGQNGVPASLPAQVKKLEPQLPSKSSTKPSPEVQAIVDDAGGVAPEFGADILIRLAESSKVPNHATKVDLYRKAFYLAAKVETPIKRVPMSGSSTDTRSGYEAVTSRLNLDRVSLQSRAVSGMLSLNAAKARELFEEMPSPTLAPLSCQEPLSYDPRLFYETLAKVARDGFTTDDKLKGRDVALLANYVNALQSHAQVEPLSRLLVNADLSPSDFGQLANSFALALSQLRGDERSFAVWSATPAGYDASGSVASVINKLNAKEISSIGLLSALREYLVTNFGSVQCGETVDKIAQQGSLPLPEVVRHFNQQFRAALEIAQLTPISEENLKGARIGPKATIIPFWSSPTSKQLFTDLRRLLSNSVGPRPAGQKNTPEWESYLQDFLTELEAWSPNGEPVSDFFAEKSIIYTVLVDKTPAGLERSKVIDALVEFLAQGSDQGMSGAEWLSTVDRLLSGAAAPDDRKEVMHAFLNSRNSALNVYARLEILEPRNPYRR
jgi:hypothetical protein